MMNDNDNKVQPTEQEESLRPDFINLDEVKRAFIASEVLNRKY